MAQIGGILNILIIIGFAVSSIEFNYLVTKKLTSDLYVYQKIKKKRENPKSDDRKLKKDSKDFVQKRSFIENDRETFNEHQKSFKEIQLKNLENLEKQINNKNKGIFKNENNTRNKLSEKVKKLI